MFTAYWISFSRRHISQGDIVTYNRNSPWKHTNSLFRVCKLKLSPLSLTRPQQVWNSGLTFPFSFAGHCDILGAYTVNFVAQNQSTLLFTIFKENNKRNGNFTMYTHAQELDS